MNLNQLKRIVKKAVCLTFGHDWRMDSNCKRHCNRCGKRMVRATYDWDKWVDVNSKWK